MWKWDSLKNSFSHYENVFSLKFLINTCVFNWFVNLIWDNWTDEWNNKRQCFWMCFFCKCILCIGIRWSRITMMTFISLPFYWFLQLKTLISSIMHWFTDLSMVLLARIMIHIKSIDFLSVSRVGVSKFCQSGVGGEVWKYEKQI